MHKLYFGLLPDRPTAMSIIHHKADLPGQQQAPLRLHMTLAKIGVANSDMRQRLLEIGERVAFNDQPKCFEITLDHIGYWPNPGVIWLGPEETPPGLIDLEQRLWSELKPLGFTRPREWFRPHVTLSKQVEHYDGGLQRVERSIRWRVSGFSLLDSRSAEYELTTWPLA